MNQFRQKSEIKEVEENPVVEQKTTPKKSMSKSISTVANFLNGNFLAKELALKQVPFVVFLAFIAMCYIANSYYAEATVKEINKIGNDLKELRSEFITTKSDLMHISKQSEVAKLGEAIELKESVNPPKKIVVTKPKKVTE